jgi:hypothetical protein
MRRLAVLYDLKPNIFLAGCESLGDMGMPFGYPQISIPGLAHYGGGLAQGLEDDLETKKEGYNTYSTRKLVNSCPVAYIKRGRGAPRGRTRDLSYHTRQIRHRLDTQLRLRWHHVNTIVITY